MKRIFAIAVAALMFAAASSAQAADVKLNLFSQAEGQSAAAADVKVSILDQEQNVVAESQGTDQVNFDVQPGDYTLVAEQESTGFNGQQPLAVGENGFSGELTLSSEGLQVTDLNAPVSPVSSNYTIAPTNSLSSAPAVPQLPATPAAAAGMGGAAGGMSSLAILGVVGAMIATTVAVTADDDEVTPVYRYR